MVGTELFMDDSPLDDNGSPANPAAAAIPASPKEEKLFGDSKLLELTDDDKLSGPTFPC